jgi:hypothetical protein
VYFAELTGCGRPATTQRSYGMDLLRWFRFLWALGVAWDQATRVEARDFWSLVADRRQAGAATLVAPRRRWRRGGEVRRRAGRECGDRYGGAR